MMKLPLELILITYELLPVNTVKDVNVKYQLLVDMNCEDYFWYCRKREILPYQHFEAQWFKSRISFYHERLQIDYQLVALGQLHELQYLLKEGYIDLDTHSDQYGKLAAEYGHVNLLEWFKQQGARFEDFRASLNAASSNGHLNVLKWVHENNFEGWSKDVMDNAAICGHLEIAKWLLEHRTESFTTEAIDWAALNGYLDIIKWLNGKEVQCTTIAMDNAAKKGYLDLVKWLHDNRTEGCTAEAMDRAAGNGHLDVVQWLHQNRTEGCTAKAMNNAAEFGHLEIVKWLHEHRTEGCTQDAMNHAAESGHLEVVKWLHENRTEGRPITAIYYAARKGHWEVFNWLKGNLTESFIPPYLVDELLRPQSEVFLQPNATLYLEKLVEELQIYLD